MKMILLTEGETMSRLFDLDWQLLADSCLMIIAIFVLFLALSYFLFNPARKFLNDRKEKIRGELEEAKTSQEKAAELKEQYEAKLKDIDKEAEDILSDARRRALQNEERAFEGERRRRVGVEPDVVRVFQDVAADVEHAEFVGQLLAGLLGREFRGLETDLLVVFEFRGHQPAVVDDGDDLLVAPRELHDERRGGHQPDHQHGHQQGGDDEGFFTYALVELALDDDGYVGHDRM